MKREASASLFVLCTQAFKSFFTQLGKWHFRQKKTPILEKCIIFAKFCNFIPFILQCYIRYVMISMTADCIVLNDTVVINMTEMSYFKSDKAMRKAHRRLIWAGEKNVRRNKESVSERKRGNGNFGKRFVQDIPYRRKQGQGVKRREL